MKSEADFDAALTKVCSLMKCRLIDIPDMIWTRQTTQAMVRERQRPFDKVLLTPKDIFLIELKFNHGKLMDHQKLRGTRYNETRPGSYYVVRAKMNVKNPVFQIETEQAEILFQTPDIMELLKWFINK
jgi:hypothetical protein